MIFTLGDPRALGNPDCASLSRSEIYYTRGDDRLPISLADDSGDVVAGDSLIKIEVSRHAEERGILEELVYLELSGSESRRYAKIPRSRSRGLSATGTPITAAYKGSLRTVSTVSQRMC